MMVANTKKISKMVILSIFISAIDLWKHPLIFKIDPTSLRLAEIVKDHLKIRHSHKC